MVITSWKEYFNEEKKKDYFQNLLRFVDGEYATKIIYPAKENMFKAFELCDLRDTKVVIIGQDPYAQPNQAMGLAFSVPNGEKLPPSLKNIYREIIDEFKLNQELPKNGDLTYLAKQGVLLLNTILTVEEGKALSHKCKEYDEFANNVLSFLNSINKPMVIMLWGDKAKKYKSLLDNDRHLILEANHPSPLSANKGGWFGNGCFKAANHYLEIKGFKPIQWINKESEAQILLNF